MVANGINHPVAKTCIRAECASVVRDDFFIVRRIEANMDARVIDLDTACPRGPGDMKLLDLIRYDNGLVQVRYELLS